MGASPISSNASIPPVNDLGDQVLFDFLYFYGICGFIKDCLLQQYFSKYMLAGDTTPLMDCSSFFAGHCYLLVTEEQPCAIVLIDITSTHCRRSPCCIYPELLSPESLRV
ncbi:uncharacterized protein LOC122006833 [Zingiber officinale]|uniref:uncharacterized protein LOC122006833 n=1 Tax=Zingiber officinale TaxID=94328 RepID=UPI001C4C95E7|nr:uncharacterized protein LOC122006833 [Zingiber officinale]